MLPNSPTVSTIGMASVKLGQPNRSFENLCENVARHCGGVCGKKFYLIKMGDA